MASTVDPVPRAKRTVEPDEHFVHLPTRLWKLLLAGGIVTWLIAAVVTEVTNDNILVPTVIIVGSFLVPVTMAAFALSRRRGGYLTTEEVVLGFLLAGTLAVVGTALLETYLLPAASGTFIAVGWIEELGKGAVLLLVAHQVHHREPRDGMVLGAVVGAGFAAFESAGYALQTLLDNLNGRRSSRHRARGVSRRPRAVRPHHMDGADRRRPVRQLARRPLPPLAQARPDDPRRRHAARAVGPVLGLGRDAHQGSRDERGLALSCGRTRSCG